MKSGTSHEDWIAMIDGRFRKVTVDCPKAPFSQELIGSMARQAGVTKKIIYDYHFGRLPLPPQTATPSRTDDKSKKPERRHHKG